MKFSKTSYMFSSTRKIYLVFTILLFASLFFFNNHSQAEINNQTDENPKNGNNFEYVLENHSYLSGFDNIRFFEGQVTDRPIKVRLLKDNKTVSGKDIYFHVVEAPSSKDSDLWLSSQIVSTDEDGYAEVTLAANGGTGLYVVEAMVEGKCILAKPITVRLQAMSVYWYIPLFIGLFGGLALFLIGMDEAGHNLQRVAGDKMREVLGKLTTNPLMGAILGTVITFLLQSSSASTVMLVGLVSSTLMTLTQAIGVIIGAKIGTTFTVQIIAFKISHYALGIIGLGLMIKIFSNKKIIERIGKILMGFGFIFFGMNLMSEAMYPLRSDPEFTGLLLSFENYPVIIAVFTVFFTSIIQSASATIGVAMALATQGMLTLEACIAISIGASVGTCATALLASLGANRAGKQVAVAHFLYSALAMILFMPFVEQLKDFTVYISSIMGDSSINREIANAFTIFSIGAGIVFLPFTKVIAFLTLKIIPPEKKEPPFGPKYLQKSSLAFPSIAIDEALHETMRMAGLVRQQLIGVSLLIQKPSERRCYELAEKDDEIDILERAIRPFLASAGKNELDEEMAAKERAIVYSADALENMGDTIVRSLLHALEKMAHKNIQFSEEGKKELLEFHGSVIIRFDKLFDIVRNNKRGMAQELIDQTEEYEWAARKLKAKHLERLHQNVAGSLESSEAHLSVTDALLNINRRITDIARIIRDEIPQT